MKFFTLGSGKKETRKIYLIAIISTFTGLSAAIIDTIWAIYIDSFVHSIFLVGLISSLITAISLISYFFVIPLIEKKDKVKLYSFSLLIYFIAYILFSIQSNFILFILIALPLGFFSSLRITSFGVLVKDSSGRKNLSKNEGFLFAIENISWTLGPLIAGYVLSSFGFRYVFWISALFVLFPLIIIRFSKLKDIKIKKKIDGDIFKNFFDFFKKKDRIFSYLLSGGVSVWWVLIYVFVPVYIVEQGFSELLVGYFLFAIPIPLVLGEYYFSSLASKKGFRRLFRLGYFIVAVLSFVCFFISNIYVFLGVLVLASVGMAMLEATTESYFFDMLNRKQHLRFYGPFNTADNVSSFVSKIFASILLFFLPFKFIFILFGAFMVFYFTVTFFIRDSFEERRRN